MKFEKDFAAACRQEWIGLFEHNYKKEYQQHINDLCRICGRKRIDHIRDKKGCSFEPGDFEYICQKTIAKEEAQNDTSGPEKKEAAM